MFNTPHHNKIANLKFSLLVPCYNAERHIETFLNNVKLLMRTFDEIIFYDDASTDQTYQILTDSGHLVIKGETNRGAGFARNQLVKLATGDYIHFHDIDDLFSPQYLIRILDHMMDVDVILCNVDWYDESKENILMSWKYSNSLINEKTLAYTISNPIGGINGLYRRSKFLETKGFNETFRIWEDADIHVQLAALSASFQVIEEVLCYAVRQPDSASKDQSLGWQTRLFFLNEYSNSFKTPYVLETIGEQAQITASNLIIYKLFAEAKTALKLSEYCGVKVPGSKYFAWRIIKFFLPSPIRINLRLFQLKNAFSNNRH